MVSEHNTADVGYHYCSIRAFRAIVSSMRFRLGNIFFMNDYMEVDWLKKIACEVIAHARLGATQSATDFCDHLLAKMSQRIFDHVYCGCFSKERDDLSQWRGYADDGRGVAIGFDLQAILKMNRSRCLLDRVVALHYDESEARKRAEEILRKAIKTVGNGTVASARNQAALTHAKLRLLAPEYKNPKFKGEREVRLVAQISQTRGGNDMDFYLPPDKSGLPSDIGFDDRQGRLGPFVEVRVPTGAIKEVVLGPRGDKLAASAIKVFLQKHQVDLKVSLSDATYGNG